MGEGVDEKYWDEKKERMNKFGHQKSEIGVKTGIPWNFMFYVTIVPS